MATSIGTLAERALRRLGVAVIPVADRPPLMTQVPRDQIATGALVELGVIAADEVPAAADQALAMAKLASVQASLAAQALVWWPDDAVPQAVAEEYVKLVANVMATSFGKAADAANHAMLEARVRKVSLVLSAPDVATEAVLSVHRDLAARGLARWTVWDLPVAAENPYVVLAADGMAAQFALKTDPRDAVQAMRSLAQITALPTSGECVPALYF